MLARLAPAAGIAGAAVVALASLVTALAYRGTEGEPYSPLTHYVSELGERGVSHLADLFNAGLVFGGAAFLVFALGFAKARTGRLRLACGALGCLAGLFGMGVGLLPMNTLAAHAIAAAGFFNTGWMMVAAASVEVARRPDRRFPRRLAVVGAATVAVFLTFIEVFATDPLATANRFGAPDPRPGFWWVAALEWASVAALLAWVALASATWRRGREGRRMHPAP